MLPGWLGRRSLCSRGTDQQAKRPSWRGCCRINRNLDQVSTHRVAARLSAACRARAPCVRRAVAVACRACAAAGGDAGRDKVKFASSNETSREAQLTAAAQRFLFASPVAGAVVVRGPHDARAPPTGDRCGATGRRRGPADRTDRHFAPAFYALDCKDLLLRPFISADRSAFDSRPPSFRSRSAAASAGLGRGSSPHSVAPPLSCRVSSGRASYTLRVQAPHASLQCQQVSAISPRKSGVVVSTPIGALETIRSGELRGS